MPNYQFICPECNATREFFCSFKEGPPSVVICLNHSKVLIRMHQNYECNFLLKGGGWPGKELKMSNKERLEMDKFEERDHDIVVGKKEAKEVLNERRKGRKSFEEYKKKNPKKVERYVKNLGKGIRAD